MTRGVRKVKHELMGFIFGLALAVCGFTYTTWQFWLLLLLAVFWGAVIGKGVSRE